MPTSPQRPGLFSAFLQACRAYLTDLRHRPAKLQRQIAFSWGYLRALTELHRPSRPRFPKLGQRRFALLTRFVRRVGQVLMSFLRALRRALSLRAILRAVFLSDFSTTLIRLIAYLGGLTLLGIMAMEMSRAIPAPVRGESAPQPEWLQVAKPFPAFSMAMPELGDSAEYGLQRHKAGGGRRDILSWGNLKGPAPHLMVEIYRPLAEPVAFAGPEHEIAARLVDAGTSALRVGGDMETKFGPVTLVEFSIGPMRQCLGFVRSHNDPQLQILGWHCVAGPAVVERETAACALDRLSLVSAGSDPKLREFFARAELKRTFCGQRSHIMTPTPKLGPAAAPPPDIKRGRLAAG